MQFDRPDLDIIIERFTIKKIGGGKQIHHIEIKHVDYNPKII